MSKVTKKWLGAGVGVFDTAGSDLFYDGGNVAIGLASGIDSRLHIKGAGNTSATKTLRIQDSDDNDMLVLQDNAVLLLGQDTAQTGYLRANSDGTNRPTIDLDANQYTAGLSGLANFLRVYGSNSYDYPKFDYDLRVIDPTGNTRSLIGWQPGGAAGSLMGIGDGSTGPTATGLNSLSHGRECDATNSNAVALGYRTDAAGFCGFAHGQNCSASGSLGFAHGDSCVASQSETTSMGQFNTVSALRSAAFGENVDITTQGYSLNVGGNTTITGYACLNVGDSNGTISGNYGGVIGRQNSLTSDYSLVVGRYCSSTVGMGVAIGNNADSSGTDGLSIGTTIDNSGNQTFVFGLGHTVSGDSCLIAGNANNCSVHRSLGVGTDAGPSGDNSISVGNAVHSGSNSINVGRSTNASTCNAALTVGETNTMTSSAQSANVGVSNSLTSSPFSLCVGGSNTLTGFRSVALGNYCRALKDDTVAQGYWAQAEDLNERAWGSDRVSTYGGSQRSFIVRYKETTDNTTQTINILRAQNTVGLVYKVTLDIVAKNETTVDEVAMFLREEFLVYREAAWGTSTMKLMDDTGTLVASISLTNKNSGGGAASLTASVARSSVPVGGHDFLTVSLTGEVGQTYNWTVYADVVKAKD